jgi:RNA polymerase sigma factor (sigma-70 family)
MERSDAELLAATRRGERAAFGTLVERYQGVVCAVTYSSTGDRALSEDVAQDTFLAAWRQLDQLREVGRLRAWLCGIARNLARKARRKTSREALVEPATEPVSDADPFERVSEHESEALVRSALDRVPEAYREVLVLYYREQRSVREVAAALELSEAAALQRLSRGRQYLAEGVANLVERSLRGALPRKSLVAGVLAALPPLVSSHADATPSSHGVPMLKIALFAAAVAAAGTTAVVVHSSSSEAPSASSSHPQVPALVVAAKPTPVPVVPSAASAAPSGAAAVAAPAPAEVPAAEALPRLDAATIARTRLHDGPSQGPADAPVTVVVFSDMQCKYCGDALGNLDQLQEDFPEKLRIVVKQMPVHKTAELAAEAALAAEAQGKFWELHDLMMAQQEDLSLPALLAMGKQAGLDVAALRKDLTAHTYAKAVDADLATARELELNGTPAFVINGERVVGNRPIAQLRGLVSEALKEAQPPSGS